MKLIGSLTSPYVRKVRVVMAEKKLDYQFVLDDVWAPGTVIAESNPLGKVPCLVMEAGEAIFDSRVIVEYLDTLSPVGKLIPSQSRERVEVKTWEALADGVSDAGILARMESVWTERSAEQRSQGVACVTADDFRWEKAHIKSTSLLGAVFARQIGVDAGATETVMFRNGYLSEAASSNVWLVKDGTLIGPPKDHLVLEGIRFGLMEEICRAQGIPFALRRITREEVLHADELLLTSATKEVLAITTLDGQPVGNGLPGPVYTRLYAGYTAATQAA